MEKYFAKESSDKTVGVLIEKSQKWFSGINDNMYIDNVKKSWYSYYGCYYTVNHEVSFGGESGELVNLAVNHYRNLAQHILVMVTSSRPSFNCRAVNTDRKSLLQAKLGNGLLDYYMREMRLERLMKKAVEYALVLGSGYIKLEWNSTKGSIYDYIEPDEKDIVDYDEDGLPLDENGNILESYPIYGGDVDFSIMSPFDVVFDPSKEDVGKNEWVLCRSFINRHNLAAKYPELASKILKQPTKDEDQNGKVDRMVLTPYNETDDVAVYEFFHERTEALPEGRYVLYLSEDVVLEDTIMPYRSLPVYRIAPSDIIGTPYGYSGMFDLLPLQDMINSLYSTTATNVSAFGVQNILNPRGNDVDISQLGDGMNFIEYNSQIGKPESLQLTHTSPEVYQLIQLLEKNMETLSGVNSVARGNPESSLRSGNALALIQSQALQFVSGLQQSYIQLLEDVGTGLINLLKDFANVPRIAAITGISNQTEMREFKSDDIEAVNRVVVDVGNSLAQTAAGRAQIAENLLQMGLIDTPEKYLMVLNTGNLDYMTEGKMDQMLLVKGENESIIKGEEVIAVFADQHAMHIREHMDVLGDSVLRKDPDLVKTVLDHIQEHITLLQTTDPNILAITNQQPLAPPGGTPIAPQGQGQQPNVNNGQMMQSMGAMEAGIQAPQMPQPAGEGELLPEQPQTPEELMARNLQGGGQ